jgi:arginyl-tRNA---protein transferase
LNSVSREELVTKVVQAIQSDAHFQSIVKGDSVSVAAIVAHVPSGQIRCTFQVEDRLMSKSIHDGPSTLMQSLSKVPSQHHVDKLASWYQETTGKRLDSGQRRITIHTMSAHQSALIPEVYQLYVHYQTAVHNDPNPLLGERKKEEGSETTGNRPTQSNHDGDTADQEQTDNTGVPSDDLDDETTSPNDLDWGDAPDFFKNRIEAMLTRYLLTVPKQYRNVVLENFYSFYQFLVEAPFPLTSQQKHVTAPQVTNDVPRHSNNGSKPSPSKLDCGLYHQHYRLGDMLIAVGVVDVLACGLSSVYLFYHPTFSHDLVALGKYAILKEIEYTRDILRLPYYYLGYYIESCQKMRYKAEYKPSELLCPIYYQWVNVPDAVAKLQKTPRHICPLVDVVNENEERAERTRRATAALHQLQMDIGVGINVTIDMLQPIGVQVVKPILDSFIAEVGPELSVQCLVRLS